MTVLDVGSGQGTQAIHLARAGCLVTGVEPSAELRALVRGGGGSRRRGDRAHRWIARAAADARGRPPVRPRLRARRPHVPAGAGEAIHGLAAALSPGGMLSVTVRNGHALAMRPAPPWPVGGSAGGPRRHGLRERARRHGPRRPPRRRRWRPRRRRLDLVSLVRRPRLQRPRRPRRGAGPDLDLELLLEAEVQAGQRDPYRWMASQLHLIGRSTAALTRAPARRSVREQGGRCRSSTGDDGCVGGVGDGARRGSALWRGRVA